MQKAVFVDAETRGFKKPLMPVSLATIEMQGDIVEHEWGNANHSFFHCPPEAMELGALATHHILPSTLEGYPRWEDEGPNIASYLADKQWLIGHKVDFDWEVIGKPDIKRICTLAMARQLYPDLDAHRLGAMAYHLFGFTEDVRGWLQNAHSAIHDATMCRNIFLDMCRRGGIETLEQAHAVSEQGRIPKRMSFGKYGPKDGEKGMLIRDIVKKDPSYVSWLLNKADNVDEYLRRALKTA